MDRAAFIATLMASPIGREVLSEQERELQRRRQEAASAIVEAEALAEGQLAKVDEALAAATAEIEKIAARLVAAQEKRGGLARERANIEERRRGVVQPATRMLRDTAPEALTRFLECAKWCALPRNFIRDTEKEEAVWAKFRPRATRVLRGGEALVFQPDADVPSRLDALHRELAMPPEIARRWEERLSLAGKGRQSGSVA